MVDLLACAYAEVGDFDSAIRYEEKALAIKGVSTRDAELMIDVETPNGKTFAIDDPALIDNLAQLS